MGARIVRKDGCCYIECEPPSGDKCPYPAGRRKQPLHEIDDILSREQEHQYKIWLTGSWVSVVMLWYVRQGATRHIFGWKTPLCQQGRSTCVLNSMVLTKGRHPFVCEWNDFGFDFFTIKDCSIYCYSLFQHDSITARLLTLTLFPSGRFLFGQPDSRRLHDTA